MDNIILLGVSDVVLNLSEINIMRLGSVTGPNILKHKKSTSGNVLKIKLYVLFKNTTTFVDVYFYPSLPINIMNLYNKCKGHLGKIQTEIEPLIEEFKIGEYNKILDIIGSGQ